MTVLRSTAGFGFPLFAPAMYNALGYGWVSSHDSDSRKMAHVDIRDAGQLCVGICCYCYWNPGAVVLLEIRTGTQGEIAICCWIKPREVRIIASASQNHHGCANTLERGIATMANTLRTPGVPLIPWLAQKQTA